MADAKYESPRLGDFAPPWEPVRLRGQQGFRLKLSRTVVVFAAVPEKPAVSDWEGWNCQLLEGLSRRVKERFYVQVGRNRNAAYEILSRASQSLDCEQPYLEEAAERAWRMILDAQDEPALPMPVEPRPGRWYDPRKRVPKSDFAVTVAWTGLDGSKHGGDRTAVYRDGIWHWAFGEQDEIPMGITVDAWTGCPARPPEWRRDT